MEDRIIKVDACLHFDILSNPAQPIDAHSRKVDKILHAHVIVMCLLSFGQFVLISWRRVYPRSTLDNETLMMEVRVVLSTWHHLLWHVQAQLVIHHVTARTHSDTYLSRFGDCSLCWLRCGFPTLHYPDDFLGKLVV